jgi:hypothetical protein
MKNIIILFFCFLTAISAHSQANDSEALLYNIGIGGVFSTVGALINKKPEDKIGKVLIKSFAEGSLGGLVTFGSKSLLRETVRQQEWKYYWGAKILDAAGTSIKENAAMNRNFWEKWHINIGFSRIELDAKNKFKVHYKIMPIAFVYTIDAFFRYDSLLLDESRKTGEFIFSSTKISPLGITYPGYILLNGDFSVKGFDFGYNLITHEIIHTYQSNDCSVLNTYYQKPINYYASKNKTVQFLERHISLDVHRIPQRIIKMYMSKNTNIQNSSYYNNYFEHEAGYYSNTLY